MGRPGIKVEVSAGEREQLASMSRSRSLPHSLVRRAKIILMAADGHPNLEIAAQCGVTPPAVTFWKKRFVAHGLAGLHDQAKSGRPRTHDDEAVAELLSKVLHEKPRGSTHWSVRTAAEDTGISKSSVARYFSLFGVQPHRAKSFKLSSDPYFIEKVRDIVGLYLSPPTNALVLCVDEKSQCQALERTQPVLPMGLGYVEGVTHDYIRHGTTTLFAALNAATGEIIAQCKPRHRHQEFISFLNHIDKAVPAALDVHLIVDNYATHKHPKVKAWLAKRPRYHMHFTPTYSSWLNQVERWFGLITQQAIRRGSFDSVRQLVLQIQRYVEHYNVHKRPFVWTATADSILAKVERLCKVISGTQH
ncbi:IS630 family transposase [Cupriavidus alkaliphilus]|uniref:Transposase n=1 Tax=Cupriavidus alkaliphilus TaxID=942866 RepID=A0A7W4VGU2_9BURK|nr:IS630 family transposase [Cupriavidus alkaliphilus]MBB3011373.1 transposase [Cupriavidus alkaliphilus]